jgi:hypothetical protein
LDGGEHGEILRCEPPRLLGAERVRATARAGRFGLVLALLLVLLGVSATNATAVPGTGNGVGIEDAGQQRV